MNGRPIAIYPGRFQPFHNSHLGIVRMILQSLPNHRLIIAVAGWKGEKSRSNFLTGREATALVALGLADWHLDGQVDVQTITLSPELGLREIIKGNSSGLAETLIFSGSALTRQAAKEAGLKVYPLNQSPLDLHAQDVRDSIIAGNDNWKKWLTESEVGYIMNHNLDKRLRRIYQRVRKDRGETNQMLLTLLQVENESK